MAYRFISNKFNGKATIHIVGGTASDIVVVGNSTVSNLTVNATSSEIISGAIIRRVIWGTDIPIKVTRGANVVIVLTQAGDIDFAGLSINLDSAASINVANLTANSFLVMEIDKIFSSITSVY